MVVEEPSASEWTPRYERQATGERLRDGGRTSGRQADARRANRDPGVDEDEPAWFGSIDGWPGAHRCDDERLSSTASRTSTVTSGIDTRLTPADTRAPQGVSRVPRRRSCAGTAEPGTVLGRPSPHQVHHPSRTEAVQLGSTGAPARRGDGGNGDDIDQRADQRPPGSDNGADPGGSGAVALYERPEVHDRRWFLLAVLCLSLVMVVMACRGSTRRCRPSRKTSVPARRPCSGSSTPTRSCSPASS